MQIVFLIIFLIEEMAQQKGEVVSLNHGVIAHRQLKIAGEDAGGERFVLALDEHGPCRLFLICIAFIPPTCHGGITEQAVAKLLNSPCHGASCVLLSSPSWSGCSFLGFHVWEHFGSHTFWDFGTCDLGLAPFFVLLSSVLKKIIFCRRGMICPRWF